MLDFWKRLLCPWMFPPQFGATTALIIGGIAAAISAGATAKSVIDQRKAAKESQKQADLAARQADMEHQRQVRDQLRKQRIQAGVVANAAANAGTQDSSGVEGGLASLGTQAGANIGAIQSGYAIQEGIGAAAGEKGKYQGDAAVAGAVAGVANQVFDATGGYKNLFDNVPSGSTPSAPLVKTTPGVGYTGGGGQ